MQNPQPEPETAAGPMLQRVVWTKTRNHQIIRKPLFDHKAIKPVLIKQS
jgi:hypothetical protein